jgi:hypothetical protein
MFDKHYYSGSLSTAKQQAISKAKTEYVWLLHQDVDYSEFDLRFVPNKFEIDHAHVWSSHNNINSHTTWLLPVNVNEPQLNFHQEQLPSSQLIKRVSKKIADREALIDLANKMLDSNCWVWLTDERIDYSNFNFDWLPDSWDQNLVHCFTANNSKSLGYTWLFHTSMVDVDNLQFKFYTSNLAIPLPTYYWPKSIVDLPGTTYNDRLINWISSNIKETDWFWILDDSVDYENFDLTALPEQGEEQYVHCFTSGSAKFSTTWLVNAKSLANMQYKFRASNLVIPVDLIQLDSVDFDSVASLDIKKWTWVYSNAVDHSDFNFSWLPEELDQDYIHCFTVKNNSYLSYTWLVNPRSIQKNKFKFHKSMLSYEPKKIYWPTFDQSQIKGNDWNDILANWVIDQDIKDEWVWLCDSRTDYSNFDFAWLPDVWSTQFIHCFTLENTQQLSSTWLVNTKTIANKQYKFHKSQLTVAVDKVYWPDQTEILSGYDLNHDMVTWIKTNLSINGWTWILDKRIDYSKFDFSWLPDDWDQDHIHCITLENNQQLSYTWLVNPSSLQNAKFKYHTSDLKLDVKRIYWPNFETIANGLNWLESQNLASDWYWVCDSRIDYSDFDFSWLPDNWEQNYIHCFTLANTKQLSYTWLVNPIALKNKKYKLHESNLKLGEEYFERIYWPNFNEIFISGFTWEDSLSNWLLDQNLPDKWVWVCDTRINYNDFNFDWLPDNWDQEYIHAFSLKNQDKLSYTWLVNPAALKNKKIKYHSSDLVLSSYDIIELDMTNSNHSNYKLQRFLGEMQSALKTAIKKSNKEWLWVISNCDDYSNFNFNWLPSLSDIEYVHCWPTKHQKKGETFLIHIPSYNKSQELKFKFNEQFVQRKAWPIVYYNNDNLADAIKENKTQSLYTLYVKNGTSVVEIPEPCLWEKRPVISLNYSNSVSLVPRDCIIKEEIYEYEYLERQKCLASDINIDIIFLHNNEKDHVENLNRLYETMPPGHEVQISSEITPRLKAYQTAASLSNTDWFLAVFAKCFMRPEFENFNWKPDYWQKPKHYIFYNHNYDLDMTYGHMAPIAYNKQLMLSNAGGLDMTLAQEHAIVPIVLSETRLTDPWDTWRTAFRETVKLLYYSKDNKTLESQYRLEKWQAGSTVWSVDNIWYKKGAQDALDYFESINGELAWVLLTNEWDYLWKFYSSKYK